MPSVKGQTRAKALANVSEGKEGLEGFSCQLDPALEMEVGGRHAAE
jgi:hypothetical protein